jgi:hypothetical protein
MKTLHPVALVQAIASSSNVPAFVIEDVEREKIKIKNILVRNILKFKLVFFIGFFVSISLI